MRINKQLIKLTSTMMYEELNVNFEHAMCPECIFEADVVSKVNFEVKIEKLYVCEKITLNKFCATAHKCYMRINKQLITLVYNDMKNLK